MDDAFYKLNHNGFGFYRTNYPPARLVKLASQLDKLSIEDKIATIGSAADLAAAGYGTTPALLAFLQGFGSESSQMVWAQALDSLNYVKSVFGEDEDIKRGLENFTLKLIGDAVEKIGWEPAADEGYLAGLLRKRLLLAAVVNGHPK